MQQRKEEQQRARKAVEEKSAQVKREKEALSKKQELETAQAAEQARREKLKVEEERQVRMCLKTSYMHKSENTYVFDLYPPKLPNFRGVRFVLRASVEVAESTAPLPRSTISVNNRV